jgi:hypothetical protein
MVYDANSRPVVGATVRLRSQGYLAAVPPLQLAKTKALKADAVTNAQGQFSFALVDSGAYYIEVELDGAQGVLIACTSGVGDGDTLWLEDAVVAPYALLRGSMDKIVLSASPDKVVRVRGLERAVIADSAGQFALRVPASPSYTLTINTVAAQSQSVELEVKEVGAGDSIVVDTIKAVPLNQQLRGFRYRAKVGINTGVNGAQFGATLYNFPLLVPIPASWAGYKQVNQSVGDIRLVTAGGTMLPYEIERWDSTGGGSVLWVMVDTIWRNQSDQHIYMYWGSDTAKAMLKPVFTPANGYLAVWHGASVGGAEGVVLRQSALGSEARGAQGVGVVPGLIGDGIRLDGVDDSLTASLNLAQGVSTYGFSCWIKVVEGNKDFALFSGKMNSTTGNIFGFYSLFSNTKSYLNAFGAINASTVLPYENTNQIEWLSERWYFCYASAFGTHRGYVLVNGMQLDVSSYGNLGDELRDMSLVIGGSGRIGFLNGVIDEMRISSVGSENHHLLSYLNQMPNQQLVSLGTIELLQ